MSGVSEPCPDCKGRGYTESLSGMHLACTCTYQDADIDTPKPPKALDAIADMVLAYRPNPKSNPAKKRKRRAAKIAKENQP